MRPRAWVLVLAAVFALLQLANVTGRDTPDTKNYLAYALSLSGRDKRATAEATIDYVCDGKASLARRAQSVHVVHFHRPDPTARVTAGCREREWRTVETRLRAGQTGGHTVPFMPERFMRIFEVRPGYPAFLVPFVAAFGATWGLWAASVVIAAAGGVLVFLVLRTLSVPVPLALTGQALYYVLPCGTTAMRPMTEGLLLALTLSALWGCALALRGRRAGLALAGGSLAALFTVKHSQALFLGVCLAAAGALIAVRRRRRGRPPGRAVPALGLIGLGAALGTVVLARLLHYPSESDSLQDLLTGHFARPDRERPWPEFWRLQGNFWGEWLRRQAWQPLFAAALGAGVWGALRRPVFGGFLVAAAATGFLTQAAHPDINIWGERLIVLAWLLPVVGIPLLLEPVVRARVPVPAQGQVSRTEPVR
ncbi:membrane protein [Streptomyces leeuwenhoekii]|uniref:Membrane protein n=1 Tax=Streptomyces leeuwenhoekii TaxID=1437453 RepID=A0ABR5HVS3_STRLW|nr:membrane protein [Streptomyces leeuwenhoekii]KMS77772.1 membrane protein [Streptomyces leeuwenhoekii]